MNQQNCLIKEQCSKCEEFFDLKYDLQRARGFRVKEPIKETINKKCGVKDLLCWKCRSCNHPKVSKTTTTL